MIKFDTTKYYYDKAAAEKVITFIERYIHHVKGDLAGKLIKLERWQKEDIIKPIFGIKKKKDGKRRFKYIYVEVPKGNAKSTLGAAIALYLLLADGAKGAEVYGAAGDREQARIIFEIAEGMVIEEPELSSRCTVYQHSIKKDKSLNFYRVISAEAKTKHGFNPSGLIFDELHVQTNRQLYDALKQGAIKRPGGFIMVMFTTAGYDKETICYEVHEYANKIKKGIIKDDTFLPVIYSCDPEDDIFSPAVWRKANPGFGSIVHKEFFKEQINEIKNRPAHESTFRRLHLNQWVGSAETWVADDVWMKNSDEPICEGVCFGGLDLATVRDVAAFILIFPGEKVSVWSCFFVPEDAVLERSHKEGINYDLWVKQGFIIPTPGNAIDYDFIEAKIREVSEKFTIRSIGYDRWMSTQIINNLLDDGFPMEQFGQGYASMSMPTKELEKLAVSGGLAHGGNPVLRWMMSNVQIESDPADNVKVTKKKSREKVDGVVALIMALGQWMTMRDEPRSRYEDDPEIESIFL